MFSITYGNVSETVQDSDLLFVIRVTNRKWYTAYWTAPFLIIWMTFKAICQLKAFSNAFLVQLYSS